VLAAMSPQGLELAGQVFVGVRKLWEVRPDAAHARPREG
jgi:hypothetical protein